MTGKNLEIISQIVLWYENSFRIDCYSTSIEINSGPFYTTLDHFQAILY